MRFFSDLVPRHILAVSILALMAACGGGGSGSSPAPPDQGGGAAPPAPVTPDFSKVDAAFQSFIDRHVSQNKSGSEIIRIFHHYLLPAFWGAV